MRYRHFTPRPKPNPLFEHVELHHSTPGSVDKRKVIRDARACAAHFECPFYVSSSTVPESGEPYYFASWSPRQSALEVR